MSNEWRRGPIDAMTIPSRRGVCDAGCNAWDTGAQPDPRGQPLPDSERDCGDSQSSEPSYAHPDGRGIRNGHAAGRASELAVGLAEGVPRRAGGGDTCHGAARMAQQGAAVEDHSAPARGRRVAIGRMGLEPRGGLRTAPRRSAPEHLEAGADLYDVQVVLGHADPATTARHYTGAPMDRILRVVARR